MYQVIDLGFRILPKPRRRHCTVIPVIRHGEAVEAERIARDRSIDRPPSGGIYLESFTSAAAAYLVFLVAACEVVFVGIQREQDPQATLGVDMQDDEIAIVFGPNLDLGAIARRKRRSLLTQRRMGGSSWVTAAGCAGAPEMSSGRSSAEIMAPPNNLG